MERILNIKHIIGFLVFCMFLSFSSSAAALVACKSPKVKCCPGGTKSCCEPRTDGQDYDLSCWIIDDPLISIDDPIIGGDDPLHPACTAGKTQFKANNGCDYQTQTCCSDGTWSGWGKKCCNGEKPITFQTCTKTNGIQGTQTRTVTCDKTTGTWTWGDWSTCSGADCTPGQTSTQGCPTYSGGTKEKTCSSSGYWGACQCPASTGNGQHNGIYYCEGTQSVMMAVHEYSKTSGGNCWHGIWSDTTCSGICCCKGDTPKLMSNGYPGCWGKEHTGDEGWNHGGYIERWQSPCSCATREQMDTWPGEATGQFRY